MAREIDVLLLGPVEARVDGAPVPLGRRKQRALLALLARDPNRVVSVDRIVDELWPTRLPRSARHSVEVYASGLRSALGTDRLERRVGGYALRVDGADVDAERLRALVERARAARPLRARRLLEDELAQVRGEALADLEPLPFVEAERERLGELVTLARELLVAARLALGEHEALVPELRARCAADPAREHPRAQLMLALYRAGRQEEALAAYRDGVRHLRALGLAPGQELRELERDILRHDPRLAPTARTNAIATLPAPMHPLVGRDRELGEIAALLRSDARLVTLTGPGGVGKTRLALAVAHETLDEWEAAFFVELAPLRDPTLVPSAIATALDVTGSPGESLEDTLARRLARAETLLVVDNLEHVLKGTEVLSRLLRACPQLRLLATSRAPLRLYGEHLYPLEPLALPEPDAGIEEIVRSAAVSLFAARARAVRPGFDPDGADIRTVAEICRRLDGLPLAIELAASRVELLSTTLLLERLGDRLATGEGPRDVPDRQRTLRATLAWSYALLGASEQALFRRLAVFAGGATQDAVERVCEPGGPAPTRPLRSVVAHNLVRPAGPARFEVLETIREYAHNELERSGESAQVRLRHVEYFVELAEAAEPELCGRQPRELLARLRADHANFLAAAGYAAEAGRGDLELRLLGALWYVFTLRGAYAEGRRLVDAALARHPEQPAPLRARAAMAAAVLTVYSDAPEDAERRAREALRLGEEVGNDFVRFKALDVLATAAGRAGDVDRELKLAEEALAAARRVAHPWAVGTALNNGAWPLLLRGAKEEARRWLEEALSCFGEVGNADGIVHACGNLGIIAAADGRYVDALGHFVAALEQGDGLDPGDVYGVLGGLADVLVELGDPVAAARLLGTLEQRAALTDRPRDTADERTEERVARGVRARLAARDEERARAEGRESSYEDGVAFALAVARSWRRKLAAARPA